MTDVDVAVVTGGAGGVGRHIVHRLAASRLLVVIADTDQAAGTELVDAIQTGGQQAAFVHTDAADATSIAQLIDRVAHLGRLRVLVNNAGGWLPGEQYPHTTGWRRSIDMNLVMPMVAAQVALPLMSGSHGSIVNVSSSGGVGPQPYASPEYGAAKAGLIRFTTCVADWADQYQVRVNCVVPHWIGLERARQQFEELSDQDQQASGGLVDPDLVAGTVAALALDDASNGRIVVLRGDREPYDIDPATADPYEHGTPQ